MKIAASFVTASVVLFAAPAAFASATVAQRTSVGFGGAVGKMVSLFGGKAASDGVDSISIVDGDRRNQLTGDTGELVDLEQEKIYRIDYARKTYTVTTFEELRRQLEEARKQAADGDGDEKAEEEKGPEYTVDVDVKKTGKKDTINGFVTHQVIVTTTVHQKGKTLEEGGGAVLTSDLWLTPRVAQMQELERFQRRYAAKLQDEALAGMDMQTFARILGSAPEFSEAMKKFAEKADALDGTAVRTVLTFESVADPSENAGKAEDEGDAESSDPSEAAAKALGGFLFGKRGSKADAEPAKPKSPDRAVIFTSTSTLMRAAAEADASKLAVPAGFRQKN